MPYRCKRKRTSVEAVATPALAYHPFGMRECWRSVFAHRLVLFFHKVLW